MKVQLESGYVLPTQTSPTLELELQAKCVVILQTTLLLMLQGIHSASSHTEPRDEREHRSNRTGQESVALRDGSLRTVPVLVTYVQEQRRMTKICRSSFDTNEGQSNQ